MIAASRRRRPGMASVDETFRLHQRIARRSAWSKRLMRGSLLALVASLIALVAGAAWLPHLLICLAALVVGLAVPVAGGQQGALASIRDLAGLSYETALDIMAPPEGDTPKATASDDPYGFKAETIDRARHSVRDVRPQSPPAWWLPALAVALALLLVGMLESPGGLGSGGTAGGPGGSPGAAAPAGVEDEEQGTEEEELAAPLEPEAGRAQEPQDAGGDSPERASDAPLVTPPAEGNDAAEPLSRFLDSLRERPQDQDRGEEGGRGGQPDTASQPPPAPEPDRAPGGEPGERGAEPQRSEVNPFSSTEEPAESAGDGSQGEDQASAAETEESGSSGADGGEEPGAQEEGGEPGEQQGETPAEQSEAAAGQAGDQLEEGDSEFQGGGAEGDDSESGEGGGAGAAGGLEQAAGVAEAEQAPPDFLEGVLEAGPENPAGSVRLPGDSDVALPPGRSLSDYQNAAEDAVTEGDIPLSYQEIIRRYFQ